MCTERQNGQVMCVCTAERARTMEEITATPEAAVVTWSEKKVMQCSKFAARLPETLCSFYVTLHATFR